MKKLLLAAVALAALSAPAHKAAPPAALKADRAEGGFY
jgi:hypothetical protein